MRSILLLLALAVVLEVAILEAAVLSVAPRFAVLALVDVVEVSVTVADLSVAGQVSSMGHILPDRAGPTVRIGA